MASTSGRFNEERAKQKNYLYAVLNLPSFASDAQIRERHRALSLIYHPDKQRDEALKEAASAHFLEIQAAYEILSDSFLRLVYDILGYEGLKLKFPEEIKHLSDDELPSALRRHLYESQLSDVENRVKSRATITCTVDARELFYDGRLVGEWFTDLKERIAATNLSLVSLRHSFTKRIGQQTRLRVATRLGQNIQARNSPTKLGKQEVYVLLRGNIMGIISHQLSPTKQLQVRADITQLRGIHVQWSHSDPRNSVRISAPLRPSLRLPPITVNYRRRLYRNSLVMGAIDCTLPTHFGLAPSVNVMLIKPTVIKSSLTTGWACGMSLNPTRGPVLLARWQLASKWLSAVLKFGVDSSLISGVTCTAGGEWVNDARDLGIDTEVSWGLRGVTLNASFSYLGQTLVMPIVLSQTPSLPLVALSVLLPASALVTSAFVGQGKRRVAKKQRLLASGDRGRRSEAEAVAEMLRDVARRSVQSERRADGLVITEALYFPINEEDRPVAEMQFDVTVPLQADVRDGQLYMPGGQSKTILRGFYDPLESCAKRLSIRYEFRGREHYAEFGDSAPVLLPLESHLVERVQKAEPKV